MKKCSFSCRVQGMVRNIDWTNWRTRCRWFSRRGTAADSAHRAKKRAISRLTHSIHLFYPGPSNRHCVALIAREPNVYRLSSFLRNSPFQPSINASLVRWHSPRFLRTVVRFNDVSLIRPLFPFSLLLWNYPPHRATSPRARLVGYSTNLQLVTFNPTLSW